MIQFPCPHCGFTLIDDGTLAGQLVACPQCKQTMQMPSRKPVPVKQPKAPVSKDVYVSRKVRIAAFLVILIGGIMAVLAFFLFVAINEPDGMFGRILRNR